MYEYINRKTYRIVLKLYLQFITKENINLKLKTKQQLKV